MKTQTLFFAIKFHIIINGDAFFGLNSLAFSRNVCIERVLSFQGIFFLNFTALHENVL